MKTDSELLKLAAEAGGVNVLWPVMKAGATPFGILEASIANTVYTCWSPLSDVGDATRLLLQLKMRLDYVGDQPCIDGVLQSGRSAEESFCRAVVRAAAARVGTTAFGAA